MDNKDWQGQRVSCRFTPLVIPPYLNDIFENLKKAGAPISALFGGAIRDSDLGALWGESRKIKDYDLRCWLPASKMENPEWEAEFGKALLAAFTGATLEMEASAGTGRLRHVLRWNGIELDISARKAPDKKCSEGSVGIVTPTECAIDRALDSDASLSAVAIGSDGQAWCEQQYLNDRELKVLSIYPGSDPERLATYSERMRVKFPQCQIKWLPPQDELESIKCLGINKAYKQQENIHRVRPKL